MFNSIKLGLMLNAIKNLKVSAKSGGKGSFSMKGLSFDQSKHDIILRKVDDEIKEAIHKEAVEVSIGAVEFSWDFPMGWGGIENGQLSFGSEEEAKLSIAIQGLKVVGKNEVFELEELSLEGVQQIQEFFLSLPIEEMAKLASIC